MTFLYWALRVATVEQDRPSSVLTAPPKEAMTSPPEARRELMADVQPLSDMEVVPLKVALQPPPSRTKARVKYFRPVADWALAIAEAEPQVST